jgi:hypothetical protein
MSKLFLPYLTSSVSRGKVIYGVVPVDLFLHVTENKAIPRTVKSNREGVGRVALCPLVVPDIV